MDFVSALCVVCGVEGFLKDRGLFFFFGGFDVYYSLLLCNSKLLL